MNSKFKKFAEETGMKTADGMAYGEFGGYLVSVKNNTRTICYTCNISSSAKEMLEHKLVELNLIKDCKIDNYFIFDAYIDIVLRRSHDIYINT